MKQKNVVLFGIVITIAIDYIASTYGSFLNLNIDLIPNSFGRHTVMLVLSIVAIYLLKKYVKYRISLPKFKTLLKPIGIGLLVSIVSGMIMSMALLLNSENGSPEIQMPTSHLSITQIIIFVFIYSSVAEEMLFRGFLLNILNPLKDKGISIFKRRISFAVIISAAMFGLYHIIPLNADNSIIYTLGMLISPSILGVVAGYYQEKYDNNIYAIIVHMSGNLMGIIGSIVMTSNS